MKKVQSFKPSKPGSLELIEAAARLRDTVGELSFGPPVARVYNPLAYAWDCHREYLERFGAVRKEVVFLGMNPGPFGMAQTGVPFGEVRAVRDWMELHVPIGKPPVEHPKRPVLGFDCVRSEVSGRRLWGLFEAEFGAAEAFFARHFVVNYCPLLFLEESGCNRTPDKLPAAELARLIEACDRHLREVVRITRPDWLIGVGRFAEKRARTLFSDQPVRIVAIPHPSPASPASNRDWAGAVRGQLRELGVW